MKSHLYTFAVALGLTSLALIWVAGPLDNVVFHWSGNPSGFILVRLADFVFAWFVLAAGLSAIPATGRLRTFLWSILLCFWPLLAVQTWMLLPGTNLPAAVRTVVALICLLIWLLINTVLAGVFQRHAEAMIRFLSVLLIFLGLNGAVLIAQGLLLAWNMETAPVAPPLRAAGNSVAPAPRLIWIVMDELSYRQVYEDRYPGLNLPAFDSLAGQSTVFSAVEPAANTTELAMPAYLSGWPTDELDVGRYQKLRLHRADLQRWVLFDQHDSVFQDARDAGYASGIAGWYIPYCRLLPDVADECFWVYDRPNRNGMVASAGVVANILAPLRRVVVPLESRLFGDRPGGSWVRSGAIVAADEHIQDYRKLMDATDALLRDRSLGFVFLHLSVPHTPGIYNPRTRSFTNAHAGYIDNLSLADECLAHIRSVLQDTHQWDASAVVLMGDHSWRTYRASSVLQDPGSDDLLAAATGFDSRPVFLVKSPNQNQPRVISETFRELRTRDLLKAIFTHQVRTPEDLAAWAKRTP